MARKNLSYRQLNSNVWRSPIVLLSIILLWSLTLGWGIALAIESPVVLSADSQIENLKSKDSTSNRYQIGQELYLENCSSCHIAFPPEVLPTESWRKLLEKPQNHYGKKLPPILSISQLLIWDYLRDFSRPLEKDEVAPLYIQQSRYFKALHPRVQLPKDVNQKTCATCHLGVNKFDYRSLSPEWDNSP